MMATTENKLKPADIRQFLEKVVITAGIGRLSQQSSFQDKILPQVMRDLALISGQKPESRKARKSIAGFKVREGQVVGLRITLRRRKMVDFLERLTRIVLPRVRDFSGLDTRAVDAGGALNIGLREQFVFPEINPEESQYVFSLGINIVPRRRERDAAIAKYREIGLPLKGLARENKP
ncbi:MAG: 50S ribosomal protein L5 [Patescibacteria group bacterium]